MAENVEQATAGPGEKRDVPLPNKGRYLRAEVWVWSSSEKPEHVARVREAFTTALGREFYGPDVHIQWRDL